MPRKQATRLTALDAERDRLRGLLDAKLGPRDSSIKIYLLEPDGKQRLMGSDTLDLLENDFGLEETIRDRFGSGKFLVRTVLPNGTFGPSRVVAIGDRYQRY